MRISDWSSDVCSSDLANPPAAGTPYPERQAYKPRFRSAGWKRKALQRWRHQRRDGICPQQFLYLSSGPSSQKIAAIPEAPSKCIYRQHLPAISPLSAHIEMEVIVMSGVIIRAEHRSKKLAEIGRAHV